MTRDESSWVNFDLRVSVTASPELAERFRVYLFDELRHIEADDAEVLALEHDLPGLWARALDRQLNPFAEIYEVSEDDLAEDYRWFGEPLIAVTESEACGQSFMAGSICTLWPNHHGGHEQRCPYCGVDENAEDHRPRCPNKSKED